MITKFAFSIVVAGLAITAASSAMAQDQRVLRIQGEVCPTFKDTMIDWAGKIDGHGTYAVPALPAGASVDCSDASTFVPTSRSWGYDDQKAADFAALSHCQETLPDGYKACVIVGQSFDR